MIRLIVFILILLPITSYGLDSAEFHLYGINDKGVAFDITPYGDGYAADGDVKDEQGIHGQFSIWTKSKESKKAVAKPAGNCVVRHIGLYTFSCQPGTRPFSGVLFEGNKLDVSDLGHNPDASRLYRSFIDKNEYGLVAGYYRCKKGCKADLPTTLILIWRGD